LVLLLPLEAEADATGHRGRAWLADRVRSRPTGDPINGRFEHLRGTALGFRNLTHCIARSLLETGGFRPQLHPRLWM